MRAVRVSGWPGFLLWALVGVLYGLTYLGVLSIGLFVLPIAIIVTLVAARRVGIWPEILGVVLGPAAALIRLASLNWGIPQCAPAEQPHMETSVAGTGSLASGTYSQTVRFEGCDTLDAGLLMWSAVALATASLAIFIVARYRGLRIPGP